MAINALGYAALTTTDVSAWREFAQSLGAHTVDHEDGTLLIRLDERSHRMQIRAGTSDSLEALGWEVATVQELEVLAARLEQSGHTVKRGDAQLARERNVTALVVTEDPSGHRVELYVGLNIDAHPFVSPRGVQFVTDTMGFGHAFIAVADAEATRAFYVDLLGMRVSDRMDVGPGGDAYFLRCNPRHHSLGFAAMPGVPPMLLHLMFEVTELDGVGRAYFDLADRGGPLTTTLGRHSNDHMFSFYVRTPSGFDMEYGWGGLRLDEATYAEKRIDVESFWGHRRTALNSRGPQQGSDR